MRNGIAFKANGAEAGVPAIPDSAVVSAVVSVTVTITRCPQEPTSGT